MSTIESLQAQIQSLATQVNQLASQVAQMSRTPVRDNYWDKAYIAVGPVNTAEPGKPIPVAFSDPEMQRAHDVGELFKTPDERRIEELESSLEALKVSLDHEILAVSHMQQRLTAADERADSAIAFVTRLIESAGSQPSIATGYLRDILDVLKPAEVSDDCAHSEGNKSGCPECGEEFKA